LAAGIAVVVLVLLPSAPASASPATAEIAEIQGPTTPPQRIELQTGARLSLGINQEAQVDFTDGTRIDLGSGGAVRLAGSDGGGARLALESGHISAAVTKQAAGAHFQVATDEATLTVLGTRFTVTRLPWGTRVEVTEGLVRTRRAADGREVEVGAGGRVDVGPGAMALRPIRPRPPAGARVLEPVADAVVVGGRFGDENRGGRAMYVVTSPRTKADQLRVYYLRFDLRSLAAAPARAELRLHLAQLRRAGMRLHLSRVDQPWEEKRVTWNTRPPLAQLVASWTPQQDEEPIDLTAAVAAAIGGELSLCLHADAAEAPDALVGFHTREASPILRPALVVIPARR
jgi:uncharacterized membrane protein